MIKEHPDVVQGTEEWDDLRRGIVTASTIGQLITPKTIMPAKNPASRSIVATLAAERITGWTEEHYESDAMLRGHLDEPIARDTYQKHTGNTVRETGFVTRTIDGHTLGYSPDGMVGEDGLIEIKSRSPKKHLATILSGEVPPENMAQVQCGIFVSGREWCDYVSFCGGMPMWAKRVHPDVRWQSAIIEALATTEHAIGDMIRRYHTATTGLPETERRKTEQDMVI